MRRRDFVKATGAGAAGAGLTGCVGGESNESDGGEETAKLGVLEDRSGNFALIGTPKWQATLLAAEEINQNGGVLGRQIKVFDPDPQSDPNRYQQLTERAIQEEEVDALIATYASPHREAIRPIINRNDQPYFYTTQYEGGLCDSEAFCTGATARQQVGYIVSYMIDEFGPEMYILGPNYNFGTISGEWARRIAEEEDGEVLGEEYPPPSQSQFGSILNRIQQEKPDFIFSTLTGQNHLSFFDQQESSDLDVPIASTVTLSQEYEHLRLDPPSLDGVYVAANYMQEVDTPASNEFVNAMQERWVEDLEYVNQECQNNYFTVYMWKEAVEEAGTFDQQEVKGVLEEGMTMEAPQGSVELDGPTHHVIHEMRIARADENHEIEFVDRDTIEPSFMYDIGCALDEEPDNTQYTPSDIY